MTEANKKLLKEAHDSIFAAQKDLIDYANAGKANQLKYVEEKTTALKSIALLPDWKKSDLVHAMDALRKARARLQGDALSSSGMSDTEKERKLKELEEQNKAAAKAKAELLGLAPRTDGLVLFTHPR